MSLTVTILGCGSSGGVPDVHLDERVVFAELGEQARDVDRPHALGLHRAEQDRPADPDSNGVHGIAGRGRCGERRPRFRKQGTAGVGQLNLVGRAVKEAGSKFSFEVAHPSRDRGLHDVQPI